MRKENSVGPSPIYLPGLNGLRAIAAMAVVISHITLALGEFGLNNKIFGTDIEGKAKGLDLAGNGVTIFFTLSGFLITYLLLKEKAAGRIKIKAFYIRRILRIWPLYYLYLFICIATILIFGLNFNSSSIPYYALLAANIPFILHQTLPFLAHYWSLGVEEQFYLFFPHLAKRSNRTLLKMAVGLIFAFMLLKFCFWILSRRYQIEMPLLAITVSRFQIMLIGVVSAILYYNKNAKFIWLTTHKLTQIAAWLCLFIIAVNKFHIASVIDAEIISIISVILIVGQITRKNIIIDLENKVCDFIGKISYGIYIIHPILIFYFSKIVGHFKSDSIVNYVFIYLLIISATLIISFVSYELFEKPFLKLKARFTTVESSNTKNNFENSSDNLHYRRA